MENGKLSARKGRRIAVCVVGVAESCWKMAAERKAKAEMAKNRHTREENRREKRGKGFLARENEKEETVVRTNIARKQCYFSQRKMGEVLWKIWHQVHKTQSRQQKQSKT